MESNGAPLSPISPPNGSNAAAASRRSFRKKAAPSPFPAAPPPEPQRHLQPSSSTTPSTSGRTRVRLQRSASDMASTTSSRLTGGAHLQQQQQQQLHHRSKNNNNNINNNNNNSHQGDDVNKSQPTSEQFATSSLGRRRIPTPPSRDSPPALPPRRPFPRPGGAVAVAVGSSPSTTPVPDASTAFFPATQTILHSTTQTPSFQASSSIATHTHVVFSGHPTRTQIPASAASSSSPSTSSATATSTTTPTTTTTATTTTTPVVPPRPPPREMVSIDSPHRYRAKPNEYVDSPHLTETSTSASISPSTSSSSPSSRVTVASRIAPVKKCKTSYTRQPRAARSTSQENLENASRDMKLRQSQTPTSDFIGGQQHHRHLRHHHRHHNGSQSTNGLSTRSSSTHQHHQQQQQQQQPPHDNVISTQPVISSGLKKPESSVLSSATGGGPNSSASDSSFSSSSPPPVISRVPLPGGGGIVSQPPVDSVYCPNCHRCTCEKCVSPRNLPSDWICKKSCYCSPETALDYASCMCCVKGYFYHCAKDSDEDASCADDPCSCGPPRCLSRWACMGVISLFLPCILCYLPLKGCIDAVEVCYNCCHRRGCRCANDKAGEKSAAGNARDSFNSTSLLQNSRSATSSSIAGGGGSVLVGRRGSLPNSISISSTAAILPLSGSRGVDGSKTAESPDLRGKFLIEAETY